MAEIVERGLIRKNGKLELKRQPDCFLSHSRKDELFVDRLAEDLAAIGVDIWRDAWEMDAGTPLKQSIEKALAKSRYVVVVLSPNLAESQWCMEEIRQALERQKYQDWNVIIPLLYMQGNVPEPIEDLLYIDLTPEAYYSGILELSRIVHRLDKNDVDMFRRAQPPRNLSEVWEILARFDWDRKSLFTRRELEALVERMNELELRYERESQAVVALDDDQIRDERLSDLRVIQVMRRFLSAEATAIAPTTPPPRSRSASSGRAKPRRRK